jgi:molybdopterin-guanine dinucleotide biosynthesis protein MobB
LNVPPHLHILGQKKSGKTKLVAALTTELVARGYRIATVKHTSHDHEFDRPETDSWKHRRAGSEVTVILSPHQWVCHSVLPNPAIQKILQENLFGDKDLVIWEGLREVDAPKIECLVEGEETALGDDENLIAIVSEHTTDAKIPTFTPIDAAGIAQWIIERVISKVSPGGTSKDGRVEC